MMENGILLSLAAAAIYCVSGGVVLSSLRKRGAKVPTWMLLIDVAAVVLHGFALKTQIFPAPGQTLFGFGPAVSGAMLLGFTVLAFVSAVKRVGPVFGVSAFITAVAALMPLVFPGEPIEMAEWTPLFRVHLSLGLLTYGLLTVDVVQAILMECQNRRFRFSSDPVPQSGILSTLPPILVMEQVFFYILLTAFLVLSVLLVTGALVTQQYYGTLFHLDHKTFLTWASWLLCGILTAGHWILGWRGRKALAWFWILCGVYVIAYLGYAFFLEYILI